MKILKETFKNTGAIHHAYIVEGALELIKDELYGFFEDTLKHKTLGNPDFSLEAFDSYGIDEARILRERASVKPLTNGRKIFLIETRAMTHEAQNALLKIFEEPTENTHFFIITPSANVFLPTLRSRVVVLSSDEKLSSGSLGKKFISANMAGRLEIVSEIIEEKDKSNAIKLVDEIIFEMRKNKEFKRMKELLKLHSYLGDRSASLKIILENICAIIPA